MLTFVCTNSTIYVPEIAHYNCFDCSFTFNDKRPENILLRARPQRSEIVEFRCYRKNEQPLSYL